MKLATTMLSARTNQPSVNLHRSPWANRVAWIGICAATTLVAGAMICHLLGVDLTDLLF